MYTASSKPATLQPRALIADDEWYMTQTLGAIFQNEGYDVVTCANGNDAMHQLTQCGPYDIALLDVMMPDMSGLEVLQSVREAGLMCPIIIVSGRTKEPQRVEGINMGADDYVTKPFSARELLARAAAVRRRSEATLPWPRCILVGDVHCDFDTYTAKRGEEDVHLTPLEWQVLRYMAYREGRAVSRSEFNVHVLKIPHFIETRTIDRHAYALRCKLDKDPKRPQHILAVKSVGYRLAEFQLLA